MTIIQFNQTYISYVLFNNADYLCLSDMYSNMNIHTQVFLGSFKLYFILQFTTSLLAYFIIYVFRNNAIKDILFELIATAELCAINYELSAVAQDYGLSVFAFGTFITMTVWLKRWDNIEASPNVISELILENKKSIRIGICIILAEIFGSYLAFKSMHAMWDYFEIKRTSVGCSAMLNGDSILCPFIVEFLLTTACRLIIYNIEYLRSQYRDTLLLLLVQAHVLTIFRITGFLAIGSFNNPVLVYCVRRGCPRFNIYTNLLISLVYNVAPVLGSSCALLISHLYNLFIFSFFMFSLFMFWDY